MTWLKTIGTEAIGLLVEDVGFAVAIVAWLAIVVAAHLIVPIDPGWQGVALFVGIALILVESTTRRARR